MGNKILFYYCFLVSFFVLASGMLTSKTPESALLQIIFLPVAGYFAYTAIRGPSFPKSPLKSQSIFYALIPLLILLAIGAWSIQKNRPVPAKKEAAAQEKSATPSGTILPLASRYLVVSTDFPNNKVNIRSQASASSVIIERAIDGQKFQYTEKENGWYKIVLENNKKGYIHKELVRQL